VLPAEELTLNYLRASLLVISGFDEVEDRSEKCCFEGFNRLLALDEVAYLTTLSVASESEL